MGQCPSSNKKRGERIAGLFKWKTRGRVDSQLRGTLLGLGAVFVHDKDPGLLIAGPRLPVHGSGSDPLFLSRRATNLTLSSAAFGPHKSSDQPASLPLHDAIFAT